MKTNLKVICIIALGVSIPVAVFAHHGSAVYDTTKLVTVKGTVVQWTWSNPHCLLQFDAKDDTGNVVHWIAEVSNPPDMVKRGWSKLMFKPGDEVTVTMVAAKNGRPIGAIRDVVVNGQTFVAGGSPGSGGSTDSTSKQ